MGSFPLKSRRPKAAFGNQQDRGREAYTKALKDSRINRTPPFGHICEAYPKGLASRREASPLGHRPKVSLNGYTCGYTMHGNPLGLHRFICVHLWTTFFE